MTIIRKVDPIDMNELSKAPATANQRGPGLLAEVELEHVAAAGGRPTGGGTGDVRCRHSAGLQ
jgi:hypothetical protein